MLVDFCFELQVYRSTALLFLTLVLSAQAFAEHGPEHDMTEQELGAVHFPTSCAPAVQNEFERGVALLHSFAFETAEAAFRHVAGEDPKYAMAHWGIARSFWRWGQPDTATRERGWREIVFATSLKPLTDREREYIAAVAGLYRNPDANDKNRWEAYVSGMERLHRDFPNDNEATAFYADGLIRADRDDDPQHEKRREAAKLLEPLFAQEPNHPGVTHYLIHAYDKPDLAQFGLPAARRYALIAPSAPHALHMPSHIFAQLGMWQEDIQSNVASLKASRIATSSHMEDQGHEYHAIEFLMYAYLQCGREAEAKKLLDEVRSLPRVKSMYGDNSDPKIYALISYSAAYVLELHEWVQAAELPLVPGAEFGDDTITYLARTIGAARQGDASLARENTALIDSIYGQVVARKLPFAGWAKQEKQEAEAWADHAAGRNDEALRLLRGIADKQRTGVFGASGDLPAREMLADMLLEMKRPEQALAEYRAELKINPNRFDSLYGAGRAAQMAKRREDAAAYFQQLANVCAGSMSTRPELGYARRFLSQAAAKY
jgi:tetratricopeptide (TPR) repeat protein